MEVCGAANGVASALFGTAREASNMDWFPLDREFEIRPSRTAESWSLRKHDAKAQYAAALRARLVSRI
jgi:hypothetical protein